MKLSKLSVTLTTVLAIIFSSCDNSFKEDLFDSENNGNLQSRSSATSNDNFLIAKNIVFENNTFSLKISLEEALAQGASEETYNEYLEIIKNRNDEVKKFTDAGGTCIYINNIETSQTDLNETQSKLKSELINKYNNSIQTQPTWGPDAGRVTVYLHPTDTFYVSYPNAEVLLASWCDIAGPNWSHLETSALCQITIEGVSPENEPILVIEDMKSTAKPTLVQIKVPGVTGDLSKPHIISIKLLRSYVPSYVEYVAFHCDWHLV